MQKQRHYLDGWSRVDSVLELGRAIGKTPKLRYLCSTQLQFTSQPRLEHTMIVSHAIPPLVFFVIFVSEIGVVHVCKKAA